MSYSGSVVIPDAQVISVSDLLESCRDEVQRHKPKTLELREGVVTFTSSAFRLVSSWNLLVPISSGSIRVERKETSLVLGYDLRFDELVFLVTGVLVAGLSLFLLSFGRLSTTDFFIFIKAFVLGWLWLVGGNLAITLLRFPGMLRRVANRAIKERS